MFNFFRKIFKQKQKYIFSKPNVDVIDRGGNNIVTFSYHIGQAISSSNINQNVFLSTTIVNDTKHISEIANKDYFYHQALENLNLEWFSYEKVDSIIGVENDTEKDRYAFCDFCEAYPQYKNLYSRYFGV